MPKRKVSVELRTGGTLPFAWWVIPKGKQFETHAAIIPPPESFTVRAYKNYNNKVIKKYHLPVKISFKGKKGGGIIFKVDNEPEELMYAPSANQIPKKK
jgi:hypothetical protein